MFELAQRNRYRERCRERDNKVGLNTINIGSIANPRNLCHMISINPPISVYSIQLIENLRTVLCLHGLCY